MIRILLSVGVMFIWIAVAVLVSIVLFGCTATSAERDAAQLSAAKGCFCTATKCESVTSATGVAATVAAQKERVKQIEVRR